MVYAGASDTTYGEQHQRIITFRRIRAETAALHEGHCKLYDDAIAGFQLLGKRLNRPMDIGCSGKADKSGWPRRGRNPSVYLESCISAILPTQMAQPVKAGVAKL